MVGTIVVAISLGILVLACPCIGGREDERQKRMYSEWKKERILE